MECRRSGVAFRRDEREERLEESRSRLAVLECLSERAPLELVEQVVNLRLGGQRCLREPLDVTFTEHLLRTAPAEQRPPGGVRGQFVLALLFQVLRVVEPRWEDRGELRERLLLRELGLGQIEKTFTLLERWQVVKPLIRRHLDGIQRHLRAEALRPPLLGIVGEEHVEERGFERDDFPFAPRRLERVADEGANLDGHAGLLR